MENIKSSETKNCSYDIIRRDESFAFSELKEGRVRRFPEFASCAAISLFEFLGG